MDTLKTIDGKDFKKSFEANMLRINFFSSTLKCEANFSSIKNKLGLDNNLVKRLEKLKELGEKKGCSVVQLYFRKIQREEFKFDEQKLSNLEKLVEVWDDYYSLNKTYNILLNECIDLLEKIDDTKNNLSVMSIIKKEIIIAFGLAFFAIFLVFVIDFFKK